ncbi:MAG: tRNA (guanosine(46)-N7)-methyltransferase TrmB [Woeseiaceae bacterium]|nr:tRNA (guanosine(46)-N7)-methyltransferase TrmB [Woeseiaceae bacterium]
MITETRKKRSVRSFVRRSGRLTPAQERAMRELWPRFGIDPGDSTDDLDETVGRRAPRILEIGFGDGETLVQQAVARPDADFLGIEVHEPGIGHCLLRAAKADVTNLRVMAMDAIDVLRERIAPGTLTRINLYFPDPWPKKRHHKRRIVNDAFLGLCGRCLATGGHLHIATDWAGYAEHIDEALARTDLFRPVERRQHAGDAPLERPVTKFERRGLARGHQIVDWKLERI